jgi:hypothetical protein
MAKKSRKARTKDVKAAAANDDTIELPKPEPVTAEQIATGASARTAAIRRSQAGKFNKAVLSVIGGKECPRFFPMTWIQRDSFMAQDTEAAKIVRERYEAHLASIK